MTHPERGQFPRVEICSATCCRLWDALAARSDGAKWGGSLASLASSSSATSLIRYTRTRDLASKGRRGEGEQPVQISLLSSALRASGRLKAEMRVFRRGPSWTLLVVYHPKNSDFIPISTNKDN